MFKAAYQPASTAVSRVILINFYQTVNKRVSFSHFKSEQFAVWLNRAGGVEMFKLSLWQVKSVKDEDFLFSKFMARNSRQTNLKKSFYVFLLFNRSSTRAKSVLYSEKWVVNFRTYNDDMKSFKIHLCDSTSNSSFAICFSEWRVEPCSSLKMLEAKLSLTGANVSLESSAKGFAEWCSGTSIMCWTIAMGIKHHNAKPMEQSEKLSASLILGQPAQCRTLFPVTSCLYDC